jgi:4-carboxymuconolactone decarboxylase
MSNDKSRPPVLDEKALSPDQRRIYDEIMAGPRGIVEGPLRVWLINPGLADKAQALGAYCRYGTRLPPHLSELAILVVGAYWRSGFEWHVHAPIAIKAGVPAEAAEAIRRGEEPVLHGRDARAVYRFARELVEHRAVSEATYREGVQVLGLEPCVDLVGILGYYTLISMTINAFHVPVPQGASEPFADLAPEPSAHQGDQ